MINIVPINILDLVYIKSYMEEYDAKCFRFIPNDNKTLYKILLWL